MSAASSRRLHITLALVAVTGTAAAQPAPFTQEAVARGINYPTSVNDSFGYGAALVDLDDDGDPDAVALGRADGVVGVWENDGGGYFTDRSATSGIAPSVDVSGVCAGDYDADGDLDLYLTHWAVADRLLRNDGGFSFTDVTAAVGLGDTGAGAGCVWGDFDLDGRLDLYLGNRSGTEIGMDVVPEPNRLYRNLPDGTFQDVLTAVGMSDDRLTFQPVFVDYDGDADADVYVSNDKCGGPGTNQLWRNDGGTFTEVTLESGTGVCIDSMGVAVGDFDGNGEQDFYPTNIPEGTPLLLNQGDGTFLESSATAGVASFRFGWGAMFLDYDNDTHQELYVCNVDGANRLYEHDGSWPSVDIAPLTACADTGLSHGVANGDIDGDGDLDILVSNILGTIRLYVNHEGETRRWIKFRVVGQGGNTHGVGTRVEVKTGPVTHMREVLAGSNSYKSQNDLTLHFGAGAETVASQVVAVWPGGTTRVVSNLPTNETWTLYPPEALGDGDGDGDSDVDDFLLLAACHGADAPGSLVPGCEAMDFDGDGDVDDGDAAAFVDGYDGIVEDCNDNGVTDLLDILAGTSTDLDQDGRPDECPPAVPAGAVEPGASDGLRLQIDGAGVALDWTASCLAGDDDYAVYEGPLGDFAGHAPVVCSTGGATAWSHTPLAGDRYFIVVPRTAAREGSYGRDGDGAERSAAANACLPQETAACP